MKEQEIVTFEKGENWTKLPPELDAAVDRAHAQIAAGLYVTREQSMKRTADTIKRATTQAHPRESK